MTSAFGVSLLLHCHRGLCFVVIHIQLSWNVSSKCVPFRSCFLFLSNKYSFRSVFRARALSAPTGRSLPPRVLTCGEPESNRLRSDDCPACPLFFLPLRAGGGWTFAIRECKRESISAQGTDLFNSGNGNETLRLAWFFSSFFPSAVWLNSFRYVLSSIPYEIYIITYLLRINSSLYCFGVYNRHF